MNEVIHACMRNVGAPPRRFTLRDRLTYMRVPKPPWLRMDPSHGLMILFRNMDKLLRDGRVVWGHIVQSNVLMYQPGKDNCPAEVVYSLTDPYITPDFLAGLAYELYAYKGTKPEGPELSFLAEHLTDERTFVYGLPVPHSICAKPECRLSVTLLVRKHLPKQRLCNPLLPLLVHPAKPFVALPVPARYWPPEFAAWWSQ